MGFYSATAFQKGWISLERVVQHHHDDDHDDVVDGLNDEEDEAGKNGI